MMARAPVTIGARAEGRDNNFNLLRMVAASAVLVSHAWPIALGEGAVEPLQVCVGYTLGTVAVTIFFAVSGFFITKSFARRHSVWDFAFARVARIYPALLVVLILTAAVLAPAFTSLPLRAYFATSDAWTYVPVNLTLRHQIWSLPGVFTDNPFDRTINASLWTLFYEVTCYGLVVVLTVVGLFGRRTFLIAAAALFAVAVVWPEQAPRIFEFGPTLLAPFMLGAGAYIYRDHIPLHPLIVGVLIVLAAVARQSMAYPLLYALAVSYTALWIGFADWPALRRYNRLGDYSYGMYIYAFPIEQSLVALLPAMTVGMLIATSFPATLALAVASWTLIESPALVHRHALAAWWRRRRSRSTVPRSADRTKG